MSHAWFEFFLKFLSREWTLNLHWCLNFMPSRCKSVIHPDIIELLFFIILSHIFIITSIRLNKSLNIESAYRIWPTLGIDVHLNILFVAIIFLFLLWLGLLFNTKLRQLLLCIFTFSTNDDHVSILIDSARVTCASTRLNLSNWRTFDSLRLN